MIFSIVIPNLDSPLIDQVVAALRTQTKPELLGEIIVVGRDTPGLVPTADGERWTVDREFFHPSSIVHRPSIRLLETERPTSAAAARNLGAAQANGEYLLFLDADCLVSPEFLERMLRWLEVGDTAVGAGIQIESDDYWVLCDNLLSFAPFLADMPPGQRPYLPSMAFALPSPLFKQLGGFDSSFAGAAGEDMDFSMRLRDHGYQLAFAPEASVRHMPARSSAGAVWRHLRGYGRAHLRARRRFQHVRPSPLVDLSPRWLPPLIALSPILAVFDTIRLLATNKSVGRFPHALPGLIWARLAWYFGVAEAIAAGAQ